MPQAWRLALATGTLSISSWCHVGCQVCHIRHTYCVAFLVCCHVCVYLLPRHVAVLGAAARQCRQEAHHSSTQHLNTERGPSSVGGACQHPITGANMAYRHTGDVWERVTHCDQSTKPRQPQNTERGSTSVKGAGKHPVTGAIAWK